ncbi:MAG: hypothetical protein BWY85_00178 [Firmicutes bacterium ADurb.Bin506]|nr:MAG: hypothetical protein BWY85_00178 [Firmicutes bacterium ADurb.Bin506]
MAKREPPVQGITPVEDPERLMDGPLTSEEMELCQNVVVFGLEYLRTAKGWRAEQSEKFLRRYAVRRQIETLQRQYTDRTGIQERTQFFAQLKVNAMVPAAINTLAKMLRGSYTDPTTGQPVVPPSKGQFAAALEVLDRANIQGQKWGGNDSVPSIDARSVQIALGSTADPMQGLNGESREKLRSLLAAVTSRARAVAASPKAPPKRAADLPEDDSGDVDPHESRDG